ncbi:MAG: hypothetical protein JF626_08015 [Polaromonas sp.]|nr:hypothetical protein [Polaromonas sp.]
MKKLLVGIAFGIAAIAQPVVAQPYKADSIPVSGRAEVVTFPSHYTYPFKPAAWPIGAGLLAGVYKPEREDENGVFYRGENRSVVVRGLEGKTSVKRYALMVGGFWMPKNRKANPKLYFYVEKSYPSVDELTELALPVAAPEDMDGAKALGLSPGNNTPNTVAGAVSTNPTLTGAPLGRTVFGAAVGAALVDLIVLSSVTGNEGKINFWWMPVDDKEFLANLSQVHAQAVKDRPWP